MIYVCKEYEVKIKLVQEKWLLRNMKIFLGYNKKIVIYWREWTFDEGWNKNFMEDLIWWGMSKFLTSEGDSPHSPSVGYILQDEENLEMDLTVFQNILPIVL